MSRIVKPICFLVGIWCLLPSHPSVVFGQKKKNTEPPILVPPQFPTLTTPVASGVKPGATTTLTLFGTNLTDPTGLLVDPPLLAAIASDNKSADGERIRISVTVPPDAPIGLYPLRVTTAAGISNVRPVIVDNLPEFTETDDNHSKETAHALSVPCVVLGRADAETADYFKVRVAAGQTLTFEMLGRRMGSSIDPIIVLHDGRTKREFIDLYADDTPGLQTDARLTNTFREAGDVIVEVRDTTYRGGMNYPYRLRIGEFPSATTAFPLAIQRGKNASIGFSGPGAEKIPPVNVTAPSDPSVEAISVVPKFSNGAAGWPVPVRISGIPESTEQEPNDDSATATLLPVPGGVSARFAKSGDRDYFKIEGKKGQALTATVLANEHNAPTEVLLRVTDAAGKEVAKSDPMERTVTAEFTPEADGVFYVICEHLNYGYGPNEVYHLSIQPGGPDFELSLPVDVAAAAPGSATAIAVRIKRLDDLESPIELRVVGNPALGGKLVAPASATTVYVPLTIKPGTKPGPQAFQIRGTGTVKERKIEHIASTLLPVKASFAGLTNPPPEFLNMAYVQVTDRLPFVLQSKSLTVEQGQTGKLNVTAKRNGFDGEIKLASIFTTPKLSLKTAPIGKGAKAAEVSVTASKDAASGPGVVVLTATAKIDGKDYVETLPISLTLNATTEKAKEKTAP